MRVIQWESLSDTSHGGLVIPMPPCLVMPRSRGSNKTIDTAFGTARPKALYTSPWGSGNWGEVGGTGVLECSTGPSLERGGDDNLDSFRMRPWVHLGCSGTPKDVRAA